MRKFLLPLAAICMFGIAGCSDNSTGTVEIDVNRDIAAIAQDAAAANLKTADEMAAAYGRAADDMTRDAALLAKEMNKIKVVDLNGPESLKYQRDIAAKRELAAKLNDAKNLFEARKSALEAAKKAEESKAAAPASAATEVGAVAAAK